MIFGLKMNEWLGLTENWLVNEWMNVSLTCDWFFCIKIFNINFYDFVNKILNYIYKYIQTHDDVVKRTELYTNWMDEMNEHNISYIDDKWAHFKPKLIFVYDCLS